jgi:hypothetical protein
MAFFANILKKLTGDPVAQDLAEYGIALAVIATGVGIAAVAIRSDVLTLWTTAQVALAAAV